MNTRGIWAILMLCWALSLRLDVVLAAEVKARSPDEAEAMSPGLQPGIPPELIITEIMQNPTVVEDSAGEWFELYNAGEDSYDLDGCLLRDLGTDSHTIDNAGSLIINPGAYLVLGRNGDSGTNGNLAVDYQYSSFTLVNADDLTAVQ